MDFENTKPVRRTYLLKNSFQLSFIMKTIFILMSMTVLSTVLFYIYAGSVLRKINFDANFDLEGVWGIVFPAFLWTSVVSLVVIGAVAFYVMMHMTHKVAGPIYKLEMLMREISEGDLDVNASLRKGDEVNSLAEAVETATVNLTEKIATLFDAGKEMIEIEDLLIGKYPDKDLKAKFDASCKKFEDGVKGFNLRDMGDL